VSTPEEWNKYYAKGCISSVEPVSETPWMDRFEKWVDIGVWVLTATVAAGFLIAAYEIWSRHLK